MKKILMFAVVISLVSCLLVTACATPAPSPAPTPTPTPAPAPEKPVELRFSVPHPEKAGLVKDWAIPWMNDIIAAGNGRIDIKLFPAGSLAKGPDSYDAVVNGVCDLTYANPEEIPGRFPLGDITCLPMLYEDSAAGARAVYEAMEKYLFDTEFKEVKILATMSLVPAQFHSNTPVHKVSDWKGLKIRAGGQMGIWEMAALEATPVTINDVTEIRSQLDRGLIDGVFFVPEGCFAFGFNEVTKYRTRCNTDTKTHYVAINKEVWANLPADVKKIFEDHSGAEASYNYTATLQKAMLGTEQGLIGYDKKVGNPGFYDLPPDEMAKLKSLYQKGVWDKWVEEMKKKGLPAQELLDYTVSLVEKYQTK